MGWFFGIYTPDHNINTGEFKQFHTPTSNIITSPGMYLAFGGIHETCLYEVSDDLQSGWVVTGLGIHSSESESNFLTVKDWRNIMSSDTVQTDTLDGHFIAFRWNNHGIEFFTDQLGLRTAYFGKRDDLICFSTRLDWVARVTHRNEINRSALGCRWLLFNQIGYESCVHGIERLGPSGHCVIRNNHIVKSSYRPWLPASGRGDFRAHDRLESLVNAAGESGRTISLGLSGGLDSRTILAILLGGRKYNFAVHTFGEPADPDVLIAQRIARIFGIQWHYFNDPLPEPGTLVTLAKSFVSQNLLVEPVSSVLRLRYYPLQYNRNQIIIDGGFGEIARRQYLNRIARLGRKALREKDIPKLFKLMRVNRADIFNPEYIRELEDGAQQSITDAIDRMPSIDETGVGNFLDLFSVRTRVPNYGSPEQGRSDTESVNYMPLVQPSYLNAIFDLNISLRKNGKIYRNIIDTKKPELKRFPLIKAGTTYPYHLKTIGAWAYTGLKNRITQPYTDPTPGRFLLHIGDFVMDTLHSDEVRNTTIYDYRKIVHTVEKFYKGETHATNYVDWWLTFELWRRSLLSL